MPNLFGRRSTLSYPPDDDETTSARSTHHPTRRSESPARRLNATPRPTIQRDAGPFDAQAGQQLFTVDRYGQDYFSLGLGVATPGWGSSSMAGYLRSRIIPVTHHLLMFWPITSRGLPSLRWREPGSPPV